MMDDYPTKKQLKVIKNWDATDFDGLMEYLKSVWHWPEYVTQVGKEYHLSTGGWSGNEDIIYALSKNYMFWALYWSHSRRGGHYVFEARAALEGER